MTHSYAHSYNEDLTFSSPFRVGVVSSRLVGSSLSGPPARVGQGLGAAVVESSALL